MYDGFSSKPVMVEERLMFLWKSLLQELEQKSNEMDGSNWFYVMIFFSSSKGTVILKVECAPIPILNLKTNLTG